MFAIEFYGVKEDGSEAGPEKTKFPGNRLADAIMAAQILMETNTYPWGRATSFQIFNTDHVLIYNSEKEKKQTEG